MPYTTQTGRIQLARSIGHVPIVENEFVQNRLRGFRIPHDEVVTELDNHLLIPADDLGAADADTRWVMSFDGSNQEVAAREAYPSSRIGYVQVAGVLVRLDQMLQQGSNQFVDPTAIEEATENSLQSVVMPGSNVCRSDCNTVKDSWRTEVFEIFRNYTVENISLLHIYMLLVGHSDKHGPNGGVMLDKCRATDGCTATKIEVLITGRSCPQCGSPMYPTDALRIHEEVSEEHSNLTSLGRLSTVLEQLMMTAYLHFLLERQPRALGTVAFVLDGPLAIFGPQAWLHTPILSFIHARGQELEQRHLKKPVIVGIEKTGQFAEHAAAISRLIPRRHLMRLPDSYIFQHVLASRPAPGSAFGRDTYYGQKFFYKAATDQLLVITIPKPEGHDVDASDPSVYPGLPNTLALLDRIGTTLFQDAVIPIALAHSFASIPLRTGSRVLTLLSRELLESDT